MFNKRIFLANVDYLLKKQNKKIGELEQMAGVASGYMSRLKKEDSTTNPSVEFLSSASDFFEIDLNTLINCELSNFNSDDLKVNEFINSLLKKTSNFSLHWRVQSVGELTRTSREDDLSYHPLFSTWYNKDNEGNPYFYFKKYNSLHDPDNEFSVNDCFYTLPIAGATLYITSVEYRKKEEKKLHELYTVRKDCPFLLATWVEGEYNLLGNSVLNLYNSVKESTFHSRLSVDILDVIDAFMGNKEKEKQVIEEENEFLSQNIPDDIPFY